MDIGREYIVAHPHIKNIFAIFGPELIYVEE